MDIRSFEFVAKAKQSQTKLEMLMAKAYDKYAHAGTGSNGDQFEIAVSQVASACGIKTEFVKASGKVDLLIYLPGADGRKHLLRIEIKSGSGIVAQLSPRLGLRTISEYTEENILPGIDMVIYAAKPAEFSSLDDLLDNSVVLSRKDFITMVSNAGGKRKSGFETCFSVQCNNTTLVKKNAELAGTTEIFDENGNKIVDENGVPVKLPVVRTIIDKKTGEEKQTRRGCPRWTDCIVMQTSYLEARGEAVEQGIATGTMTSLRAWLEENGRA